MYYQLDTIGSSYILQTFPEDSYKVKFIQSKNTWDKAHLTGHLYDTKTNKTIENFSTLCKRIQELSKTEKLGFKNLSLEEVFAEVL
jgi:hypothetical protein